MKVGADLGSLAVIITIVCAIIGLFSDKDKNKNKGKNNSRRVINNSGQTVVRQSNPRANQRNTNYSIQNRVNNEPNILTKAKENNQRFSEDKTVSELETLHRHSEKSETIPTVKEHSKGCDNFVEQKAVVHEEGSTTNPLDNCSDDVKQGTSSLGTIEDLMAKGYDGNLSFDRDFISESMDMLQSISSL